MPGITTMPNPGVTQVTFNISWQGLCLGGPYIGKAEIMYEPQDVLVEIMSFEAWARSVFNDGVVRTGEEVSVLIHKMLMQLVGNVLSQVTVTGVTTAHGHAEYVTSS